MTLNNMGRDCSNLGETVKALEYDTDALPIWHEVEDRRGEALAMMTIGWAYSAQNKPEQALASELAASLAKTAGDPEIQGGIETSLIIGFRDQHRLDDAIFFGSDAVSAYQQIRKNISRWKKVCRLDLRNRSRQPIACWRRFSFKPIGSAKLNKSSTCSKNRS